MIMRNLLQKLEKNMQDYNKNVVNIKIELHKYKKYVEQMLQTPRKNYSRPIRKRN